MPVVDVPKHGLVEFPDSMSGDEISAAIQKNFPDLSPNPTQDITFTPEQSERYRQDQMARQFGPMDTMGPITTDLTKALFVDLPGALSKSLLPSTSPEERMRGNLKQMALAEDVSPSDKQELAQPDQPSTRTEQAITGIERGVFETGKGLAEFMTSPLGIATLGSGVLPKLGQRGVALAFGVTMAKETPEIARQLGEEYGKPPEQRDYGKISQLITTGAINTGFAATLGAHALAPSPKASPLEVKADEIAPVAPLTAEALKQTTKEVPSGITGKDLKIPKGAEPPSDVVRELMLEGVNRPDAEALVSGTKTIQEVVDGEFSKHVTPAWNANVTQINGGHAEAWMEGYRQAKERLSDILERRQNNADSLRTDEGRISPQGDVVEVSQNKGSENLQQPTQAGSETGNEVQRLAKSKSMSDIMQMSPPEVAQWKKQVGYLPETSQAIAAKMTPEELAGAVEMRDSLDAQREQLKEGLTPTDNEKMMAFNQVSLKRQILNEVIQDYQAAAPKEPELVGMGGALAEGEAPKPSLGALTDSLRTLAEQTPESKPSEAFNLGKSYAALKDNVSSAVSGLKAAAQYMKLKLEGKPVFTDYKRALGQRHLELSESVHNAKQFAKTSEKAVPDKTTQEAISNWIDTGGDPALLAQAAKETKARYAPGYEAAQKLTPEQVTIAQNVRNYFESRLQDAIDAGILEAGIEDYIHRTYEKESPWKAGAIAELRSGVFTGQPSFAKKRVFQYDFEAEKAGYKPIKSFIKRIAAYDLSLNKAIADRKLVKSMMEIKMPDGRPMIDVAGIGVEVPKEGATEATLIKPSYKPTDAETPVNNRGDYKPYDYPALRKWKWVANDANGNPILVQGDVLIHPDAIPKVKALFESSSIRKNALGRSALAVSSTIKQTMLDLSGFHPTQITVHGWEHRSDIPFGKTTAKVFGRDAREIDFSDPDTRGLIKGGLVVGDTRGYELFSEGLTGSSLTRHIPGIGKVTQAMNQWLFGDYIPRLKVATGLHALERNRQRFPKLNQEELYHLTANQMNAAFGELNYEMMGRSKTTQDFWRLALLAPDFLEARARFASQAVTKYGAEQRQALILGAAALYITARIANKLLNGEYHFEPKNAFSVIYNKKAYSLRTVQGDILHMFSEPSKFLYGRLNPVFGRTALEAVTERDYFGRKRTYSQQAKDFATTVVPISLRGLLNPREQTLMESMLNAIGITERRSTSSETINDLAQKFKEDHKIRTDPGEFIYDPDKDPFRGVKQAATFGDEQDVSKAVAEALDKGDINAEQLKKHFSGYATRPFTGSKSHDTQFYNQLSDDNKLLFNEARKERKEVTAQFWKGYKLYIEQKRKEQK